MGFGLVSAVLLLLALLSTTTRPASSAVDCSSLILNMADCLSFVSSGSTVEKPEGSCCSGLKTVLKSGPSCLCEAFRNSASMGVTLNVTKAATLPQACSVVAPPSTSCGLSVPPPAAPGASPAATPSATDLSMGANEEAPAIAPSPAMGTAASSSTTVSAGSEISGLSLLLLFFNF